MIARGAREGHDVAADRMLERDARDQVLQVADGRDALERVGRQPPLRRGGHEDALLLRLVGVAEPDAQQEPVELRLGERERPLQLDGVLRGEHEERLRERVAHAVHRHLALLHRFEERGLRLRRGAVDLVGQDAPARRAGPAGTRSRSSRMSSTDVPVTSVGMRSGVNWMRWNDSPSSFARRRTSVVLPTPGTSSIRTCEPVTIPTITSFRGVCIPKRRSSTRAESSAARARAACGSVMPARIGRRGRGRVPIPCPAHRP